MRFMSTNSKNRPSFSKGSFERNFGSNKEERLMHSSDKILLTPVFLRINFFRVKNCLVVCINFICHQKKLMHKMHTPVVF